MSEQLARIEGIQPGLQARGFNTGAPVVDWLCHCGTHERAEGSKAYGLLVRVRVGVCPHRLAEGRAAA